MIPAWFRHLLAGTQFRRAEQELRRAELTVEALISGAPPDADLTLTRSLLLEGRTAIDRAQIDRCWHMLNQANRILVARRPAASRRDATRVLLIESKKLSEWRRKAIESLVNVDAVPEPEALKDALTLRDEFYENRYQRIAMQREQLTMLLVVSLVAIVSILAIVASAQGISTLGTWEWRTIVLVIMFGVLGACFSAARTVTRDSLQALIPELVMSNWTTLSRAVLGASPGIAVYAFLQSGLLDLGPINTAKALAIAFAGGFSERLVVKAVETVAGKEDPQKK